MANYKISKRIGRGGMAEVFLAVQEGIGGFEKLVVVKRIFPQFCDDDHFVSMFLQEAKLAASIRHPNVVHINDIDRDDEGYFLVMEYLAGESLAYIWEALRTHKKLIPPNIVCRIGAQIASGLHHAHIATDAAGHPQPVVHRDVTPSNLIVCYNGTVKIVDFGVAKATLNDGTTKAGALKGKMSYLSPEQVKDEPIDGRADVFQLGICLHEMLTGRRLFRGKTDHSKITAVMEKDIVPPSQFNPRVPRILDEVVLKALARDKANRHTSAEELRRDLDLALNELGSVVSESDVGEWMRETFRERHSERLTLERDCVSQIREGRPAEGSYGSKSGVFSFSDGASRAAPQRTPTMATVLEHQSHSAVATSAGSRKTAVWTLVGIVAFVCLVSVFAWQMGSNEPVTASSVEQGEPTVLQADLAPEGEAESAKDADDKAAETFIHVTATPESAEIFVDDKRIGIGYGETRIVFTGTHKLRVASVGYQTYEEEFDASGWPKVVRLKALPRGDRKKDEAPPDSIDEVGETDIVSRGGDGKDGKDGRDKKDAKKDKGDRKSGGTGDGGSERSDGKEDDKKDDKKKDDFFNKTDNIDPFE